MFLNFNNLWYFDLIVDNLLDWNVSWYFSNDLYNSFNYSFVRNNSFLDSLKFNEFINHLFHNSIYLDIDILFDYNLFYFSLENWNLNDLFHLFDSLLNHKFRNHSLNDLRDLDDFLNHTRNHYNFLNDFLNFYHFGNFNHFFNDLFNWNFNFLDSIDMSEYFNNLFFNIFDWFRDLDIVIDNFLYLNYFWLSDNNRISDFNYNRDLSLDHLNTGFFNYFLNFYYSFMNNWNFNDSLYLVRNFLVNLHNFGYQLFYLSNSIHWHYLLYNDLNWVRPINSVR